MRNLPKLVVNVTDCGIDGKPLRHVAMEEKPKLNRLERMDFSFYFSGVKKKQEESGSGHCEDQKLAGQGGEASASDSW